MNTADQTAAVGDVMTTGTRTVARHGFGVRAAVIAVGASVGLAMMAGMAPARADVLRDVLGFNPFSKGSSSGELRSGVYVDEAGEEIDCPRVDVFEGGSSVRRGEGSGLSYQMTIGNLARECERAPDGRIVVNVGVDVRALIGPAGRPGRFSSPLTILLKQGDTVLSRVTRQVSVAIPAGEGNAMGELVERGIALPEDTRNLLIEVGFGGAAPKARGRGR